ncbi:MAG: hypothetical protein AB7G37_06400 [Solirubrobacteraceae bacterium]
MSREPLSLARWLAWWWRQMRALGVERRRDTYDGPRWPGDNDF